MPQRYVRLWSCVCLYRKRSSSTRTCKYSLQAAIPASGRLPCTECVRVCRLAATLCTPHTDERSIWTVPFSFEMNRSEKYSNSPAEVETDSRICGRAYNHSRSVLDTSFPFEVHRENCTLLASESYKRNTRADQRFLSTWNALETKFDRRNNTNQKPMEAVIVR